MPIVSERDAMEIEKQIAEEQAGLSEDSDAKGISNDIGTVRHDVLTKIDSHVKELRGDFMTAQDALGSIDYFAQQDQEPGVDTKARYAGMGNMLKRMDKHMGEISKLMKTARNSLNAAKPILKKHFK